MSTSLGADEARALTELAFDELAAAAEGVARIHQAIARVAAPVTLARTVHDPIASAVYSGVAGCLRAASSVGGLIAEEAGATLTAPPSYTRSGALTIAAFNGLIGDVLAADGSPLATEMSLRVGGAPVTVPTAAATLPAVADRLVVFVHGLMETEHAWGEGAADDDPERWSYGGRLAAEHGLTPLYVRYNTGRRIGENGRALSELLADVVADWPVPVTDIVLIGHSMGGLVIRAACHTGRDDAWAPLVSTTVSLGSPHLGAPLAKAVHYAALALDQVPLTRPLSRLLRRRSGGVRDLFHGDVAASPNDDPDGVRQTAPEDVPLLATARHYAITATMTRSPGHIIGWLLGDGLVRATSGQGKSSTRDIGFAPVDIAHLGDAHHFTLLRDEAVYRFIAVRVGA